MLLYEELTHQIINCFYTVYNKLGYGFLERVYENALLIELRKNGFTAVAQKPIKIYYNGEAVGDYFSDIVVNNQCIIELKATDLCKAHEAQLTNYLRATDIEVGLLLGFGEQPIIKRKVFLNSRKKR